MFCFAEEPVKVIPDDEQMSSVVKFAIDLYSLQSTFQLIYTNDVKVLIDIIVRQLSDLSNEDKVFPMWYKWSNQVLIKYDVIE